MAMHAENHITLTGSTTDLEAVVDRIMTGLDDKWIEDGVYCDLDSTTWGRWYHPSLDHFIHTSSLYLRRHREGKVFVWSTDQRSLSLTFETKHCGRQDFAERITAIYPSITATTDVHSREIGYNCRCESVNGLSRIISGEDYDFDAEEDDVVIGWDMENGHAYESEWHHEQACVLDDKMLESLRGLAVAPRLFPTENYEPKPFVDVENSPGAKANFRWTD